MDLLDNIMAQLAAAVPDYPQDKLEATARKIRRDLGGSEAYIRKAPAEGKVAGLGSALAAGVPLAQAVSDLGVSRGYAYKLVHRLRRRRAPAAA